MKRDLRLTADQQLLVEENTNIVHWTILRRIRQNRRVCGLEYDDLFQEGCLWLCLAARTFRPGKVQFATYAKKVVYHGLVSHCRRVAARERHIARPNTQDDADFLLEQEGDLRSDPYAAARSLVETLDLLERYKQSYAGTTRRGIEALELQLQGMRLTDIAKQFGVPANHVGAWISRAASKMREDAGLYDALLN